MALDRKGIEKRDFPIERRGYSRNAVGAHLSSLADEVEELKASTDRLGESLTSAATEQLRSIMGPAETAASEIKRRADEEARLAREEAERIRAEAMGEAEKAHEEATRAREFVAKVSEVASVILERIGSVEGELGSLSANLKLLDRDLGEMKEAEARPSLQAAAEPATEAAPEPAAGEAAPEPALRAAPEPAAEAAPEPPAEEELAEELEPEAEAAEPEAERVIDDDEMDAVEPQALPSPTDDDSAGGSDEREGARIVALNMAMNGVPREATERYLASKFKLSDRDGLLNEVYGETTTG